MEHAEIISRSCGRPSSRVIGPGLLSLWLSAAAMAAPPKVVTHCRAGERVEFSCSLGKKTISLCASGMPGHIESLSYRYGAIGKVENEFTAQTGGRKHFYGTVMPARPGALVRQVWFDKGDFRYLVLQCVGGDCPFPSGLAVLRGDKVLSKRKCEQPPPRPDLDTFSRDLADFGSSVDDSHSNTPLLELGEYDNLLDEIFGGKGH